MKCVQGWVCFSLLQQNYLINTFILVIKAFSRIIISEDFLDLQNVLRLGVLLSLDTTVDDNGMSTNQLTQQTVEWFRYKN